MADKSAASSSSGASVKGSKSAAAAAGPIGAPQGAALQLRNLADQLQAALDQPGERESVLALLRQLSASSASDSSRSAGLGAPGL